MEKLTPWKTGTLGIQHVLAMYAGVVIVPLIVAPGIGMNQHQLELLISIDLFTSGIATLLQVVGGRHLGVRLPVMLGCAFQAVAPMIVIGNNHGITAIYGAIIGSGILVIVLSQFMEQAMKLFPAVVRGSVITVIGFTLISVAMGNAAGGDGSKYFGSLGNMLLALFTLILVIVMNRFFKGFLRAIAVLLSLIVGTIVAYFFGMVDLSPVWDASWFHFVRPFYFGLPTFNIPSILTMTIVGVVSMIESTGVYMAVGEICDEKVPATRVKKGLRAEGLAAVLGGIFNSFPYTTFSQNVGLVAMTKVKTRNVVIAAGVFIMILGLVPKIAALTSIIPPAVLGGAMIAMFGMVAAQGIKILGTVDFSKDGNLMVMGVSIALGLGVTFLPDFFKELPNSIKLFLDSGIVVGSISAVGLNLVFNYKDLKSESKQNLEEMKAEQVESI